MNAPQLTPLSHSWRRCPMARCSLDGAPRPTMVPAGGELVVDVLEGFDGERSAAAKRDWAARGARAFAGALAAR